ncbi:MAG: hypothetical protein K9I74_11065 [Bacteroidales bacterium]|nr:hypothetical protein [Bacteroidales bacterium]
MFPTYNFLQFGVDVYIDAIIALIAFLSLFISIKTVGLTKTIAKNNARPILQIIETIDKSDFNYSSITLENLGTGTAVIENIVFYDTNNNEYKSLIHLFDFPVEWWADYYVFTSEYYFIKQGQGINLGLIEKKHIDENVDLINGAPTYDLINHKFMNKKSGIIIEVYYKDVYGDYVTNSNHYKKKNSKSLRKTKPYVKKLA